MSPKISVAVFGLSPALEQPVLEALQSSTFADKIEFPIKVVTRHEKVSTSQIEYIKSDLTNLKELASKLKGTGAFIELLAPTQPLFDALETLSALVKPKIFIPSQFGVDVPKVLQYAPGFMLHEVEHSDILRALGIKTVDVLTGFFTAKGSWLHEIVGHAGIDTEKQTYDVRGDINQKFAVTDVRDVANTVAALVTAPDFSKLPDTLRVFSEEVTIKQVIQTYEKEHELKLTKGTEQSAAEVLKEFQSGWAAGFSMNKFLYYLHVIISQGLGKGAYFEENDREFINPGESVWRWEKY